MPRKSGTSGFMLSTGLCRMSRENSPFALVSRADEGDWVGIIRAV